MSSRASAASREISPLRASTAKIPRLAPLARDDNGTYSFVAHTTDSDDGAYSFVAHTTSLRSPGMTGKKHGIDWNELHASTPTKTKTHTSVPTTRAKPSESYM
ncbi:hypothetical protein [Bifidobacterium aquikefiri]|uniref:hypothetical protein n=1 Tax=Bifidobacterium aquikefiri TaxID=1653207 RepID=UPI0023F47692|nr:hypothetical protein [Bifidobacterium aquikefiri]